MLTVTLSKKLAPVPVASYAEASKVVCEYRDGKGRFAKRQPIGGSAWYRALPFTATSKGAAIHEDGVQVAFVSYNGRVWKGVEDMKIGHEEIKVEGV